MLGFDATFEKGFFSFIFIIKNVWDIAIWNSEMADILKLDISKIRELSIIMSIADLCFSRYDLHKFNFIIIIIVPTPEV